MQGQASLGWQAVIGTAGPTQSPHFPSPQCLPGRWLSGVLHVHHYDSIWLGTGLRQALDAGDKVTLPPMCHLPPRPTPSSQPQLGKLVLPMGLQLVWKGVQGNHTVLKQGVDETGEERGGELIKRTSGLVLFLLLSFSFP